MRAGTRRGRRNRPVFIERSGLRRKLLRYLAVPLGCACAGYLVFLVVLVGALKDSGGQVPPRVDTPLPTGNARHDSPLPDGHSQRPGGQGESEPRPTGSGRPDRTGGTDEARR